jgi:hypothetical protein
VQSCPDYSLFDCSRIAQLKWYHIIKEPAGKEPSAETEKTNYAAQQPFQGVELPEPIPRNLQFPYWNISEKEGTS